jgi:NAD(P)H-dependent FMN reductase
MNIVIISGSPRKGSITHRIALHLQNLLKDKYAVEIISMQNAALPPIQTVFSTEERTPAEHMEIRRKLFAADSFLFVSPEYNGGYSSVMKNFLDHFPKATYARKPIGIVTGSDGLFGGMRAAMQLQLLICALFAVPCPQMLVTPQTDKKFDEEGNLLDGSFAGRIENFLTEYLWQAETLYSGKMKTQ